MNWLKKLIGTTTSYPDQELPDKALKVLNDLDCRLLDNSTELSNSNLSIGLVHFEVTLWDQAKPVDAMVEYLFLNIKPGYVYLPRGIAFIISADGNWHFFIGVRRDESATPMMAITMWSELLSRTNSARSK